MHPESLVRDPTAFAESFLPTVFVNREREIKQLRTTLSPLPQRKPARHIWIHGMPGTGKTSAAKFLLNEFEERHGIRGAYVNCWDADTFYSILDKLCRDFRILGAERLSTLYKMERFEKHLNGRPLIMILDEIDKPSPKERDSIIYNFCSMPNVSLLCICNSRYFYYTLDSRVRSRLDPALIEFQPYTPAQIWDILRQRAEMGLRIDSVHDLTLRKAAREARGDARIAIQALCHAAFEADRQKSDRIKSTHFRKVQNQARDVKKKYLLEKLSEHHKLIHGIIREKGEIQSGPLWKEYLERCRKAELKAAASRTFTLYVKQLAEVDLVNYKRALGIKGNVRIFSVGE